ncbi:MAG: hypothetical protein F9K51_05645 [Candidatus Dadabacteria bacterium]|nr:MAG: hypothetical protein F9K51_05645 [Candidatus Dadabacteria bacterium]
MVEVGAEEEPAVAADVGALVAVAERRDEQRLGGRAHAAEIARLESARLGMDERVCVTYLTERIQYDLGPREQEGIVKYSEFLSELGLSKKISGVDIYAEEKN